MLFSYLKNSKFFNELPRGRAIEVSSGKNFIFSLMKPSGFQTFLLTTDAEHRGILSIKRTLNF